MSHRYDTSVRLDTADARRPQLVVAIPPDQADSVRQDLETLASSESAGISAQDVILSALHTAAEQAYFWSPEWQERERAADLAIAEGRVQTFEQAEDLIDFLDEQ